MVTRGPAARASGLALKEFAAVATERSLTVATALA